VRTPVPIADDALVPAWKVTLDAERPEPSLRGTMLAGALAVAVGFGGFFGWAATADLDSAAVAPATVIVDSRRKTVSHLEGGILDALLVREGDAVEEGQPLLRLDDTQSRAAAAQVEGQRWLSLARAARLRAELGDRREADFPADLLEAARTGPVAAEAVEIERRLLLTRWETHEGQIRIRERRIAQLREQIAAIDAQIDATRDRLRFTRDELGAVRQLFARGYERRPRLLELQRAAAELEGRVGELTANRAEAEQGIAQAELEIQDVRNTRHAEAVTELQRTQGAIAELDERLRGAADVQRRRVVLAPQAGKVVDIRAFTPGSAIGAGAPILDIVPQDDELVLEARVAPADIDSVRVGQPVFVRLSAYKQRIVPPVDGEVVEVSADRLRDDRSGEPYFTARVRLAPDALDALPDVRLYPGMPAEVMLRSRPRKALDYFLAPVVDSMRRSLREE
jgi:HlyD family secretion protein